MKINDVMSVTTLDDTDIRRGLKVGDVGVVTEVKSKGRKNSLRVWFPALIYSDSIYDFAVLMYESQLKVEDQ